MGCLAEMLGPTIVWLCDKECGIDQIWIIFQVIGDEVSSHNENNARFQVLKCRVQPARKNLNLIVTLDSECALVMV